MAMLLAVAEADEHAWDAAVAPAYNIALNRKYEIVRPQNKLKRHSFSSISDLFYTYVFAR